MKVVMDSKDLSAETGEVTIKGKVTEKGGEIKDFESTIKNIKMAYRLGTSLNEKYKIDQLQFKEVEWTVDIDCAIDVPAGLTEPVWCEVVNAFKTDLLLFKEKFQKGNKKGEFPQIKNFPMDTVIPIAAIYYMVQAAEIYEVEDNFITIGFNLYHWKMLTDK